MNPLADLAFPSIAPVFYAMAEVLFKVNILQQLNTKKSAGLDEITAIIL